MHKEWVRIDDSREAEFWQDKSRPDKWRYVEEGKAGTPTQTYVEYWEDVPDENDEPQEDGLYKDSGDERWIRLNGYWAAASDCAYAGTWAKWEDYGAKEYTPFRLVEPSDY